MGGHPTSHLLELLSGVLAGEDELGDDGGAGIGVHDDRAVVAAIERPDEDPAFGAGLGGGGGGGRFRGGHGMCAPGWVQKMSLHNISTIVVKSQCLKKTFRS